MKPIKILTISLKLTGPRPSKNEILSIGYCLGSETGEIEVKKRISIKVKSQEKFDETYFKTVWLKNIDKLKILIREGYDDSMSAIQEFSRDLDQFDELYDLRILINSDLEMLFINYYFDIYLDRKPLNYIHNTNKYRKIYDVESYNKGILRTFRESENTDKILTERNKLKIGSLQDNLPDNDAEYIYELHTLLTYQ